MRSGPAYRCCVFALAGALVAACTPPAPPSAPARAEPALPIYEEELKPVAKPHLAIIDLVETPTADKKTVTVSGRLVNRGTGTTRQVYVHVEALDHNGAVLISADSEPSTEAIAPGASGSFSVTLENRRDVDRYHVEAISR
jgi:hypothetical protein